MECSDPGDGELIRAYLAGEPAALETLFERYRRPFYGYLNRMLNNDATSADDLFQELWVKIIAALPRCREPEKFPAWSFRIARNLTMQHFRRNTARWKIGMTTDDGELPEADSAAAPGETPDETLAQAEFRERLEATLPLLSREQLEVFQLRRSGVGFREIAEIQKCPLNTALSRMRYAVNFLKERLAGE